MRQTCNEWFYDAEPSFTNWGPIESVSQVGSYKFFKVNTLATVTNMHHSLFTWDYNLSKVIKIKSNIYVQFF